jgi:hypothetical protein
VIDYASSEKRPVGWLELKVESRKLKTRTKADLVFELACSFRCRYSLIRLKLCEKQTGIMTQLSVNTWLTTESKKRYNGFIACFLRRDGGKIVTS